MNKPLNRDVIKYIAMFTMLLNHIALVLLDPRSVLGIIFVDLGYFTAVTMCYFLVEGYEYTCSKGRYALRILLVALPSQVAFMLAFGRGLLPLNMMFSLLICLAILVLRERMDTGICKGIVILGLILISAYTDWPIMAPIFTLLFAQAREKGDGIMRAFIKAAIVFGIFFAFSNESRLSPMPQSLLLSICQTLPLLASGLVITRLYNGRRMTTHQTFSKWFFYLFYPLHLLVLWAVSTVVG